MYNRLQAQDLQDSMVNIELYYLDCIFFCVIYGKHRSGLLSLCVHDLIVSQFYINGS